jgi:hypothetical protein
MIASASGVRTRSAPSASPGRLSRRLAEHDARVAAHLFGVASATPADDDLVDGGGRGHGRVPRS